MINFARVRFVPIFVSLALLIAVCGVSFLLIKSHVYQKIPHQLTISFTVTFVSALGLAIYLLLLQPNKLQPIFVNPTLLLASWFALNATPMDHNQLFATVAPMHYFIVGLTLLFTSLYFLRRKPTPALEGWGLFVKINRAVLILALIGLGSFLSSKDPILTSAAVFSGLMSFLPLTNKVEE